MPLMDPLSSTWYPMQAFHDAGVQRNDIQAFLDAPSLADAFAIDGLSLAALAIPSGGAAAILANMWIQLRSLLDADNFSLDIIGQNVPASESWDVDTLFGTIADFIFRRYNPNQRSASAVLTPHL